MAKSRVLLFTLHCPLFMHVLLPHYPISNAFDVGSSWTTDGDDGPNNTPWAVVLNILGAIMYGKNNCALQRCASGFV